MKYTIKTGGRVGLVMVYDENDRYVNCYWADDDHEAVAKAIAEMTTRRKIGEVIREFEV